MGGWREGGTGGGGRGYEGGRRNMRLAVASTISNSLIIAMSVNGGVVALSARHVTQCIVT